MLVARWWQVVQLVALEFHQVFQVHTGWCQLPEAGFLMTLASWKQLQLELKALFLLLQPWAQDLDHLEDLWLVPWARAFQQDHSSS